MRGLAETLRAELAPHGIVVACAYPPDTARPGSTRENELKPPETERISAAIKPREADDGGRRRSSRGIERDRLVITADVQTAALARGGRAARPVRARARWTATVRKVAPRPS